MPVERGDLVVGRYRKGIRPILDTSFKDYVDDELDKIELVIDELVSSSIQAEDDAPENPQRGMIRFNKQPWDPLGDGSETLVYYDGATWKAL